MNLLFVLLLFFVFSYGQNYIWPTNASEILTSAFGEYRENRFHSGIDISTWNREGFPCFAIDSGYVYRVRTSPYGYGRAIYLKLKDNRIAVYAHLKKLNSKLELFLKQQQYKTGKYNQDLYFRPSDFPVNQGDTIAFTGSTGIGSPHFHFEIRETMDKNVHTLSFYPQFKDTVYPMLSGIVISALDSSSYVNGSQSFSLLNFKKIASHKYHVTSPINIYGNAGIAVNVFDRTSHRGIGTGVYKIELFLNDRLHFYSIVDSTRFSQNHFVNLDREFHFVKYFGKKYQQLYKHPENLLNHMYPINLDGTISFTGDSIQQFKINVYDFSGNSSSITGTMRFVNEEMRRSYIVQEAPFKNQPMVFNSKLFLPKSIKMLKTFGRPEYLISGEDTVSVVHWNKEKPNLYIGERLIYQTKKDALFESTPVFEWKLSKKDFPLQHYQSAIYHFVPLSLRIHKPIEIKAKLPDEKTGLFFWDSPKKRWKMLRYETMENEVSFKQRSLDIYTFIKDTVPPIIHFPQNHINHKVFKIEIKDNVSGIYDERNFNVTLNGKRLIAEYDFEEEHLLIDSEDIVPNSWIKVFVKDNLGNASEDSVFVVK